MTTAYTSLLGLALPVTGELSGTWGDTVNNSITSLLDSAIAGTTTITSDADVTLTTTTGSANTSRQAIILWTAGGTATRTIIAPAQSKIYTVINSSSSTQSIILAGAGPTSGVTIAKGESALCAWNGSDFIKISNTAGPGTFTNLTVTGNTTLGDAVTDTITVNSQFVTGTVLRSAQANTNTLSLAAYDVDGTAYTNLITLTAGNTPTLALTSTGVGTINNMSIGATTASTGAFTTLSASSTVTLSGGTINGVAFLNGSNVLTTGSALTFDGTKFTVGIGSTFSDAIADFYQDTNATRYVYARNPNTGAAAAVVFNANAGGGGDLRMTAYGSGHSTLANHASLFNHKLNGQLLFGVEGSERMRLTSTSLYTASTINVGIGLSNATAKLQVFKGASGSGAIADSALALQYDATTTYGRHFMDGNGFYQIYAPSGGVSGGNLSLWATNSVQFRTAGAAADPAKMTLDSSGNLGLGVTPSAWSTASSTRALQFAGGSVWSYLTDRIAMIQNSYLDSAGNYKYINTDAASMYRLASGVHAWFNAPSGTAGNTVTFTQAMTLDASGNLLVGTTSTTPTNGGVVSLFGGGESYLNIGHKTGAASGAYYLAGFYNGSLVGGLTQSGTTGIVLTNLSDYRLKDKVVTMQGSLAKVLALNPVTYKWKSDGSDGEGFIAHELQTVIPTAATGTQDEVDEEGNAKYQGINLSALVPHLVKAIQEQQALIVSMREEIEALKIKVGA